MTTPISRRGLLTVAAGAGAGGLLTSCVGSGGGAPDGAAPPDSGITFQNSIQETAAKAALEGLVEAYEGEVTMNSVATEQFRAQLTNYLRANDPPEVISWYAGSVARDYAKEGLLLDLGSLWEGDGPCAGFSPALKELSQAEDGTQIFVPTNYYWWSVFYKKSAFQKWGVEPPSTWDEFLALCQTLADKDVFPLANGIGPTPWMASGWFDYLNLRVNGPDYHRELLAGEHSFTDPEVVDVMDQYARLIPFFDPNMASYDAQQAATPLAQDEAAMYLVGAFVSAYLPEDQRDDLDFFSVPVINPDVPTAEEAPTDGFFASANCANPDGARAFLTYLAEASQQETYIKESGSANLPTSSEVDTSQFSPLVQKGIELLSSTEQITQFFNRDSSDALQSTADAALTRFLAEPEARDEILQEWQTAAERVFSS